MNDAYGYGLSGLVIFNAVLIVLFALAHAAPLARRQALIAPAVGDRLNDQNRPLGCTRVS